MHQRTLRDLTDLSGKTAVITGGAMGIGAGIAARLAEAGASVVIADTDAEAGKKAVDALVKSGHKAIFVKTDVTDEANVKKTLQTALKEWGSLDILVNDAGIYPAKPFLDTKAKDFDEIMAINVKGVFLCTKAFAAMLIKKGGSGKVINISSVAALHPAEELSVYTASKHAVWGLTRSCARELGMHRIQVNAIAPGYIDTPGTREDAKEDQAAAKEERDEYVSRIPLGRVGYPDDIGCVAVFLASGLSDYLNGSQIVVDGGLLLN